MGTAENSPATARLGRILLIMQRSQFGIESLPRNFSSPTHSGPRFFFFSFSFSGEVVSGRYKDSDRSMNRLPGGADPLGPDRKYVYV